MRRIRGLLALSVGLALLAAACGGDQKHSNSALPKAAETQNAAPDSGAPAASTPAAPTDSTPAADFYYDETSVTVGGTAYALTNTKNRVPFTCSF